MGFEYWDNSGTVEGDLLNNLLLVDNTVEGLDVRATPEFHVLGGAALIFNGINYNVTLDIDTANKISDDISDKIETFINSMASEVVVLPKRYMSRLIPYRTEVFQSIKVFTLCNEDILYTKLSSNRAKDFTQVKTTNILQKIDKEKFLDIVNLETPEEYKDLVLQKFYSLSS